MGIKRLLIYTILLFFTFNVGIAIGQQSSNRTDQPSVDINGQPNETRVLLTQEPLAFDLMGREALSAHLLPTELNGTPEAPLKNARFTIKNRSASFYTYASGWVTFYSNDGIRCGEAIFSVPAIAPGEIVETDAPGLRLRCSPATWRIVATNLLTRLNDLAKPQQTRERDRTVSTPLTLNLNGDSFPIRLDDPIEVKMGDRIIRVVVSTTP
jgi:hypothetical protein